MYLCAPQKISALDHCAFLMTESLIKPTNLVKSTYRQPGLVCTPQNFAPSSKFLGKIKIFGTKVTSEGFLSSSQNLKVTPLQGCTKTKL
jgi:hypothetical protein